MYWSMVVFASKEIQIPEHLLVLDPGTNAFTVRAKDMDAFQARLTQEGARVIQCNRLDEFEAVEAEPFPLP